MTPKPIVLATRNTGKLREIRAVLGDLPVEVASLEAWPDLPEPVEDGETFAANARLKARYYAQATGCWALADDSGLAVDALNGAPGVYSARFAADSVPAGSERQTIDQANNDKLLASLADVPDARRTARFLCYMALAEGDRVLLEADGKVEGRIAHAPAGGNGFGYDPLFFVPQFGCTTAEMTPEQKNAISHRGQAVRSFAEALEGLLEQG